jgi:hypothetical protein
LLALQIQAAAVEQATTLELAVILAQAVQAL